MTLIHQEIPTQAGSGKFGIADVSGKYTYYATFQAAIDAAVAGQTVEMFADVIETGDVQVNLKNGVNINMNGHTYTLDSEGTTNTISDNNVALICTIFNGTICRTGGLTQSDLASLVFYEQNASTVVTFEGVTIKSSFNTCATHYGTINGGFFQGVRATHYFICHASGIINGARFYGSGYARINGLANSVIGKSDDSYGLYVQGTAIDSKGYSSLLSGIFVYDNAILLYNCYAFSSASTAFQIQGNGATKFINCTGYSTANAGININTGSNKQLYNSTGYSTVSYGITCTSIVPQFNNCTAISDGAIAWFRGGQMVDCKAICKWNNAGGHGFYTNHDTASFINCYAEVANSSALAISATGMNIYMVGLKAKGCTTLTNATNIQSNTEDSYGNILIG